LQQGGISVVEQRKKVLFIVMLAILIVAGSFYSFWQKNFVGEVASSNEALAKGAPISEEKTSEIIIYITGAVNKPGVYKASQNARIFEIVTMAGGLTSEADETKINMAQSVKDGMHIHVVEKIVPGNTISGNAINTKAGNKVNINTADKSQLDTLPGVGPAMAERIIEYRQTSGGFKDIEELKKVQGIGSSKFEKLKEKISI
jgi:competence protein ComEA